MAAQNIGTVKQLIGTATAEGSNGVIRTLHIGDRVNANDLIVTGDASVIQIVFKDGSHMDLGRDSRLVLDSEIFNPNQSRVADADASVTAIQKAILAGEDPGKVAAATAAGDTANNGTPLPDYIHSIVQVELTGQQVTPTSGYETQGLVVKFNNIEIKELLQNIASPNGPPTPVNDSGAGNDALVTNEDTALVIAKSTLLANDTDPEGDTLSITGITTTGTQGTVTDNGDGTFNYNPNGKFDYLKAGQSATDSFTYTVSDGQGGSASATVTVVINGVNDAPIPVNDSGAGNDALVTNEDTSLVIAKSTLLANDTDPEGDTLSITGITTTGTQGTVTDNGDGTFNYNPNGKFDYLKAGQSATDSFTYTVSDGQGGSASATVTVVINGVNDAPIANPDSATVAEGGTVTVLTGGATSVRGNDTDADTASGSLAVSVVSGPAHGSLTLNADGTFSYTHDGSETTTDSFTYKLNDGSADSNTATVSITVTPVNDAPGRQPGQRDRRRRRHRHRADRRRDQRARQRHRCRHRVRQSGGERGQRPGARQSDAERRRHVQLHPRRQRDHHRQLHLQAQRRQRRQQHRHRQHHRDPGERCAGRQPGQRDRRRRRHRHRADRRRDQRARQRHRCRHRSGSLAVSVVSGPAHGSLTLNADGTFSYTHDGSETTTDSFTYKLNDGSADSNTATVSITVTPVNDAPVANPDSATVAEGGTVTVLTGGATSVRGNDTDADTASGSLAVSVVSGPAHGSLTLNADGTFSYTHDGSETTTDSFTYKLNDGSADSNTATVSITVTPVNDAPGRQPGQRDRRRRRHRHRADRRRDQRARQRHRCRHRLRQSGGERGQRPGARQPDAERRRHVQLHPRRQRDHHRQLHLQAQRRQRRQQHRHRQHHRDPGERCADRQPGQRDRCRRRHRHRADRRRDQRARQRHRCRHRLRQSGGERGQRPGARQPDAERRRHVQLHPRRQRDHHRQLHLQAQRRQRRQQHRHRQHHRDPGERCAGRQPGQRDRRRRRHRHRADRRRDQRARQRHRCRHRAPAVWR